jgi:hypothetical protein
MLGSESVAWRGRIRHLSVIAAATTIAAAGFPAVSSAKLIEAISVSADVHVAPGQTARQLLKCPARAVALNAGVPSGLTSIDSVPRFTARGWDLSFAAGSNAIDTRAVLRCVRMQLPQGVDGVSLAVETRIEPVDDLPPGLSEQRTLRCSTGFTPTGWGLDRTVDGNGLSIASAIPTKKAWRFVVENTGDANAAGTLYGRCLEKKQFAETGQRHSFATRVATSKASGGSATRSCRSSEFSVATGFSLPITDDIFLTGTGPFGRRDGEWHFAKASGAGPVKTSLVCLSTTTSFR